jgi:exosortase
MLFLPSTKLPWLVLLAVIWLPVVYLLGAQWSVYPEYQYGWAVPLLCLYLAGQRFSSRPPVAAPGWKKTGIFLLVAAGLVYWVMRVLQEANPIWRLASYGLALAAVAMTLLTIYLTQGGSRTAHYLFPVAFLLVAVPWPTPVEGAVIQTLTRFNTSLVVEVLSFSGVPALAHGNVIEIGTGMVGIDEACSGIRSFQATLMVALFLGAFYRLRLRQRWWLLGGGPALALAFNFTRMLVLVLVAAHSGLPAMERWHDPTGVALLVGCFLGLWGVATWMARGAKRRMVEKEHGTFNIEHPTSKGQKPEAGGQKSEASGQWSVVGGPRPVKSALVTSPGSDSGFQNFSVSVLAVWLVLWAVTVEVSNEAWFRNHEARGDRMIDWTAQWPVDNPTVKTNIIPENALRELQCDQNSSVSWTGEDGSFWQAFYLRWLPSDSFYGRTKVALSKAHNPAICLPASGLKLQADVGPVLLPVRPGFSLWFDRYVFTIDGRELYVFFSQTEDMTGNDQASLRSSHLARLRAALVGSRNYGQNNFEVAIAGPANPDDALRLFSIRLPELIKIQPASQ